MAKRPRVTLEASFLRFLELWRERAKQQPDRAHELLPSPLEEWREAWAGDKFKIWASRGAADALRDLVKITPGQRRRIEISPVDSAMYAPSGAVGPDGKRVDLWWFNVEVEDATHAYDDDELIAAIAQFRNDHPESGYHETVREIMRKTEATRLAVRAAMSNIKGRARAGRRRKRSCAGTD
jgi:hypothetical protein